VAVRLLVVQNDRDKPLGRVGEALGELGAELEVAFSNTELPAASGFDGLVVLPGLADPVDDDASVHRARSAIEDALAAERPVLGLCLGGQLLVQALGGDVYGCPPEVGFHEVRSTPAAREDPLLAEAPERFSVFHAHAYAFAPPAGSAVLLENDVCIQACRIGSSNWAFQCHPEVAPAWVTHLGATIRGDGTGVDPRTAGFFRANGLDPDGVARDATAADAALARVAEGIARGFAARCEPV